MRHETNSTGAECDGEYASFRKAGGERLRWCLAIGVRAQEIEDHDIRLDRVDVQNDPGEVLQALCQESRILVVPLK